MLDGLPDHVRAGPDVPKVDRPVDTLAQWLGFPVDVHSTRQGVRHHEYGRREIVGADFRVDTCLEIPISREHGRDHETLVSNGLTDWLSEGTRIPDAGRTPVPDHSESELIEILHEAGCLQVVGDDF